MIEKCANCGAAVATSNWFCGQCGTKLRPLTRWDRWAPREIDFATRVAASELGLALEKGFSIEPETVALFFRADQHVLTLSPGDYSPAVSGVLLSEGRADDLSATLATTGDVVLKLDVRVETSDPLPLWLECRATVRLEDPLRFVETTMQGHPHCYARRDMADLLQPVAGEVVTSRVARSSVTGIARDSSFRSSVATILESAFARALDGKNTAVRHVEVARCRIDVGGKYGGRLLAVPDSYHPAEYWLFGDDLERHGRGDPEHKLLANSDVPVLVDRYATN